MTRSWLGIRYAEPVDGARRWLAPVPVEAAPLGRFGPSAWQSPFPAGRLSELWQPGQPASDDCLFLNVWAPATPGPHPVMVFVHGGGLTSGDSSRQVYDGAALAAQGLVVVTCNYRLGAAGFLPVGTANRGLLDVVEVLRWVQRNAATYGGDPGHVTLAGHSGGASLVLALLGSPSSAGLLQRAVLLSPTQTPFVPLAAYPKALDRFRELAGDLDVLSGEAYAEAAASLEAEVATNARAWGALGRRRSTVALVTGMPSLPDHPLRALSGGSASDVDVLVTWTQREWQFYSRFVGTPTGTAASLAMLALVLGAKRQVLGAARLGDTDAAMTAGAFSLLAHRITQVHQGRTWLARSDAAATEDLGAGHGSDLALWLGNPGSDYGRATAPGVDADSYVQVLGSFVSGKDPGWAEREVLALPAARPERPDPRLLRLARALP